MKRASLLESICGSAFKSLNTATAQNVADGKASLIKAVKIFVLSGNKEELCLRPTAPSLPQAPLVKDRDVAASPPRPL